MFGFNLQISGLCLLARFGSGFECRSAFFWTLEDLSLGAVWPPHLCRLFHSGASSFSERWHLARRSVLPFNGQLSSETGARPLRPGLQPSLKSCRGAEMHHGDIRPAVQTGGISGSRQLHMCVKYDHMTPSAVYHCLWEYLTRNKWAWPFAHFRRSR